MDAIGRDGGGEVEGEVREGIVFLNYSRLTTDGAESGES